MKITSSLLILIRAHQEVEEEVALAGRIETVQRSALKNQPQLALAREEGNQRLLEVMMTLMVLFRRSRPLKNLTRKEILSSRREVVHPRTLKLMDLRLL